MSTIGTRVDNESKNNTRVIQFQQNNPDANAISVFNPYPNTITVNFPYPQSFSRCEAALTNLYLFYSWFNITAAFGNNTFSYQFPTAAGYINYDVTVPDGFYSIDELSEYFQTVQIANGTYLIDANGSPVTYLSWIANSVYYATTIISNPVPNTLPSMWTLGVGFPGGGLPATAEDPTLVIHATVAPAGSSTPGLYSFSKTLGISPGSYPVNGTTTPYTFNGQFPPVIESTNAVNVSVNFINNGSLSSIPSIIASFSPQVGFGEQINLAVYFPIFLPVSDAFYQQIIIQFLDENFKPLNIEDPHISGTIIVRGR